MTRLALLLGSGFGSGYAPKAPGTAGALLALAMAWPLVHWAHWNRWHLLALAAVALAPAIWSAGVMARTSGRKDPSTVVIDEVLGQWLTMAGATDFTPASWVLGFLLFRLFDILKPPPVRQLERLPGGIGIVADDLMAGIFGALVLFGLGCFNLY